MPVLHSFSLQKTVSGKLYRLVKLTADHATLSVICEYENVPLTNTRPGSPEPLWMQRQRRKQYERDLRR